MSEHKSLSVEDILGVATAGIRGAAFTDMAEDLAEKTGAIVDAYEALHVALEAATAGKSGGAEAVVTTEDFAVVEASRNYARAEIAYLLLLQGYLEFVQPYGLSGFNNDGTANGNNLGALKGLIPGA